MELKDAVVIVTGGTGGLGSRICRAFAQEGARVVIVYQRSEDRARQVAQEARELGGVGFPYGCDVTKLDEVEALVAQVVKEQGRIDVLVNNASFNQYVPFQDLEELSPELWEKILHYNATAPYLISRAAARPMRRQGRGRIINIASVAGLRPGGSSIAYAVSKAALIHLTRCLAKGLAPEITVNCVAPGFMEGTGMTARLPAERNVEARRNAWLKQPADKDDVAAQVVTFARSDTTTGQTVAIDAGGFAH